MTTQADASFLFSQAQAGLSLARRSIVARFSPVLCRIGTKLLPGELSSDISVTELVQDAFQRCFDEQRDSPGSEAAIFLRLREALLDAATRISDATSIGSGELESPIEHAVGRAAWKRHLDRLERLPEAERAFLVLLVEGGLEFEEVAELLGCSSADSVRNQVSHALGTMTRSSDP